jgi:SNF2 family DNA or RNA helicase
MLSQMRMLCDSTYILDQKTRYDTKVEETLNILRNVFESGDEKVVIFSQWERMTRLIAKELDVLGVRYEYLHGGIPSEARKNLTDNFTELPESRVFLSTDAGSTGLNLQVASILINLDLPWNPAVLEQRIARIYRIGQKKNIQVINLVASQTIEERMLSTLNFKTSLFEGILDNGEEYKCCRKAYASG